METSVVEGLRQEAGKEVPDSGLHLCTVTSATAEAWSTWWSLQMSLPIPYFFFRNKLGGMCTYSTAEKTGGRPWTGISWKWAGQSTNSVLGCIRSSLASSYFYFYLYCPLVRPDLECCIQIWHLWHSKDTARTSWKWSKGWSTSDEDRLRQLGLFSLEKVLEKTCDISVLKKGCIRRMDEQQEFRLDMRKKVFYKKDGETLGWIVRRW